MTTGRTELERAVYPDELLAAEDRRWRLGLAKRFQPQAGSDQPAPPTAPTVGMALSGGGIRSATFSLGIFQALAGNGFLKHIDFISTISGGGYFGTFLGGLFARDYVRDTSDVASVLLESTDEDPHSPPDLARARSKTVDWLREHGRYLSPRGAGDLLLFFAVLFRNWLAVNVVIALFAVAVALSMQLPRFFPAIDGWEPHLPGAHLVWWSPWMAACVAPFALVPSVVWAYWLRHVGHSRTLISLAVTLLVGAIALSAYYWQWSWLPTSSVAAAAALVIVLIALVAVIFRVTTDRELTKSANHLSQTLKLLLGAGVFLLVAGLIDSLGQTAFYAFKSEEGLGKWIAALGAFLAGVGAFARQIAVLIGSKASGQRPGLPFAVIANIAAALLLLILTTTYSAVAHAIAWEFKQPNTPPGFVTAPGVVKVEAPENVRLSLAAAPVDEPARKERSSRPPRRSFLGWLISVIVLAWGFGQTWRFVNDSTHQPLYSARLARAYLGASNPDRWRDADPVPVIEPLTNDDFPMEKYWPPLEHGGDALFRKGAPQHLIGVTINATVGGRSQIEERDRKGIGFAIGPAGLSVGARHHAVFGETLINATKKGPSLRAVLPSRSSEFNALDYGHKTGEPTFRGETLRLSQWTGISGAAFSTGVGSRTNIGLSLLTGFMNVRLGYWWEAGTRPVPTHTKISSWSLQVSRLAGGAFQRLFPVHRYLADEFLARFPGVSRERWYLSDGGHFENLGGYELIRRRLPLVIIIDSGEDSGYVFDDVGNLVRKARTDFDAEIQFLTRTQLKDLGFEQGDYVGTLDDLRASAQVDDKAEDTDEIADKSAATAPARAYATIATITYESTTPCSDDGLKSSFLIYVKPSLRGDEPADLLNYHNQNEAFPHQSTADQFFDEAQWESYRKLGETIGCRVWADLGLKDPTAVVKAWRDAAAKWVEQ